MITQKTSKGVPNWNVSGTYIYIYILLSNIRQVLQGLQRRTRCSHAKKRRVRITGGAARARASGIFFLQIVCTE